MNKQRGKLCVEGCNTPTQERRELHARAKKSAIENKRREKQEEYKNVPIWPNGYLKVLKSKYLANKAEYDGLKAKGR